MLRGEGFGAVYRGCLMPSENSPKFELPKKLEKILAALATNYAQKNEPILQRLLVNSRYYVEENTEYDNWDMGQYGHTIHFDAPSELYQLIINDLHEVEDKLCKAINRIANCPGEWISKVLIELQEDASLQDWREKSGVLLPRGQVATIESEEKLRRIWEPGHLRVFLSHKAEYKEKATALKNACFSSGLSCFVAHEDIEPTKEWQAEIELALFSMEAMILLMTEKFHDSNWTDQEIGVAIGRGVPIISIRLGIDPYGFIGKYQALSGHEKKLEVLAIELFNLLFSNPSLKARVTEGLVVRFEKSATYSQANMLIEHLKKIEKATPELIKRLEKAGENNSQVRDAFDVKRELPSLLKRLKNTG
jgi:hypothetical protein